MKFPVKTLLLFIFLAVLPLSLGAQLTDPFSWSTDLSPRTVSPGGEIPFEVQFLIPPKHHLYKDKMGLMIVDGTSDAQDFSLKPLDFTPSMKAKDPFTGRDVEIFEAGAVIKTAIQAKKGAGDGDHKLKLLLTYQGCSDQLCFRFTQKEIEVPITVASANLEASKERRGDFTDNLFQNRGFLWVLFFTFLGGIGSAFTPCVLPIIPITLAFIGVRKTEDKLGKNFFYSLLLVLSMSLTYALLGLTASLFGRSLGFLFQNPYFLLIGVALFLTFSLSLFGLFEIQVPLALRNRLAKLGGAGAWGSILSGFTVGFLAAPCVGPVIASLLLYVAHERNLIRGFVLLFVYGVGMGSLFLIIGTFYHRLAAKIHGGRFTVWIERTFAVLLLLPAAYYGSIAYGHFHKARSTPVTSMHWIKDSDEGFAEAKKGNKPLFVDFFASWCFPCVEMEKGTFSNAELQNFLSSKFVPVKVDCTEETPQCKKMVDRYGVVGWPTFLILNPNGEVMETVVGKNLTAKELEEILRKYGG